MQKAAAQNFTEALYRLAEFYVEGSGVTQNIDKALRLFEKAAELGDSIASNHRGVCYLMGTDFPQDDKKAVYWFKKGVEQGNDESAYNLSQCYRDGIGVQKNLILSHVLLRKAASLGSELAINDLLKMEEISRSDHTRD